MSKYEENPDHLYNDYHIDIWFLISQYILPEDVARFALICRKTNYVISIAKFWLNLHRRYYDPDAEMPAHLQLNSVNQRRGLRATVIRLLYYIYPPFVERRQIRKCDLTTLHKYECLTVWYTKIKNHWAYCYKFRPKSNANQTYYQQVMDDEEISSRLKEKNDVHANPNEGCRLLIVNTNRFTPLPNFDGNRAYLKIVTQPLSQDLKRYKVVLTFVNYHGKIIATETYDPVIRVQLLQWWIPEYSDFVKDLSIV